MAPERWEAPWWGSEGLAVGQQRPQTLGTQVGTGAVLRHGQAKGQEAPQLPASEVPKAIHTGQNNCTGLRKPTIGIQLLKAGKLGSSGRVK